MKMTVSNIASVCSGEWTGEDVEVQGVSIDSRILTPAACYIAIAGERFDGHDFVDAAVAAGAKAVIVNRPVKVDVPQIIVADCRQALAALAGYWRHQVSSSVVGITGSNGKTTVKEMTASILKQAGSTLYTQGNLNNDLGVPLTLLRLAKQHRFAAIEMGANHIGEIAFTSNLAKPDVAIITNVGPAHLEGFGSVEGIAQAKGELIESLGATGVAVLNRDDRFFDFWCEQAGSRKVISFGLSEQADVWGRDIRQKVKQGRFVTAFILQTNTFELPVTLALAGIHNVKNALAAAAAAIALGLKAEQIQAGLAAMQPVAGRLTAKPGVAGGLVIDDSYNANPASLQAALEVLLETEGEPWVVLGALGEMGVESQAIHRQLGQLIKKMGIKKLLATGADAEYAVEAFGSGATFFQSQSLLIESVKQQITGRETVLVKGSRAQQMEKVVAALTNNEN
jgi:UDP-N-acetylmuramoyl-tripeptide--D-alanyl-D-alanine ligase